ncbi:MAG: carboxymuconolactone decarboxylase family protein [Fulvimarina manganoxydans]|uniref:carboxymuconolactone decarboxylase family protein n=1 Tax=Fulvimarina manganoxydans TaxID=937218 RepID=UPI002356C783|nr:carboxymuconolactone decarboxylase family protein [Fulvimarina manganoxydans]MCK5932342.1 carboxymuconolactone decarboxylase family protein [Fulvimarina manganoxydans]
MTRIALPDRNAVPQASKPILDAVEKQLGSVPNMFRLAALSPAALSGLTANNAALGKALDLKTRERIALAVAEVNGCNYCLSAHSYLAANLAKLDADEIGLARLGRSADAKANVAVGFAAKLVRERGHVTEADIDTVREVGFSDAQIIEIVAVAAENVFTNFLNIAAETEIDFPVVESKKAA